MNNDLFKFEDAPEQKKENEQEDIQSISINDDFVIGGGFVIDTDVPEDNIEENKEIIKPREATRIPEQKNNKSRKKDRDDLYEYYEDTPEQRRKSVIKTVIWAVCIFAMAILLAVGIIYFGADYMGIGFGRGKTVTVEIPLGSSTKAIAEKLEESGAVKSPFLFRMYSKFKKYDSQYKYGVYTFDTESGYEGLAQMLIKEGAKAETVKVKIPEGATIDDIKKLLAEAGVCDESDFIYSMNNDKFKYDFIDDIPTERLYYRLEGYLYPDTYEFYSYDSEECAFLAINKMLSNLDSKLTDDMKKKIKESDYTFHEIMSLSSVIQLEAGNFEKVEQKDREKVASVFYNRLEGINWDGPKFLQSDPTTFYPYGDGKYNTYKTEGIPVGPLCAPSIECIKAAINPDRSCKAVYFVTDKSMKFYYNETLSGHNKTVAELKRTGNWVYSTLGS